jgi:hypothetical protein
VNVFVLVHLAEFKDRPGLWRNRRFQDAHSHLSGAHR